MNLHVNLFAMNNEDGEIIESSPQLNLFELAMSLCESSKEEALSLLVDDRRVSALRTIKRPGEWNEAKLARLWNISPKLASNTLRKTTRLGVRYFGKDGNKLVARRFLSGDRPMRYQMLDFKVFHDMFFSKVESVRKFTCAQIYSTDFGWVRVFPMTLKSDVHHIVDEFFHRYGVPMALVLDNASKLMRGQFGRKCRQAGCNIDSIVPHSPWQNRAEAEVRENKRMTGRWMVKSGCPRWLWCYCSELAAMIRSHTALKIYGLGGEVPETVISGQTADISHLCEFAWYQWVMC